MRSKAIALYLILTILCAQMPAALSQTTVSPKTDTWVLVKTLPAGDDLVVVLKNGKTIKGMMYSANDLTLHLSHMGKTIDLDRKDIQKVYHVLPDSGGDKHVFSAIGGFVGFLAGLFVAVGLSLDETHRATTARKVAATVAVPAGIIGGGLAGRALDKHQSRDLIYEAEKQ